MTGGAVNAVLAAAVLALLVVGYPLYQLVTTGQLDATSALMRGGLVVAACAAGITLLVRLALSWEKEAEEERRKKMDELYTDMEEAVVDGTLTAEDPPGPQT